MSLQIYENIFSFHISAFNIGLFKSAFSYFSWFSIKDICKSHLRGDFILLYFLLSNNRISFSSWDIKLKNCLQGSVIIAKGDASYFNLVCITIME